MGALAVALTDTIGSAVETATGHAGTMGAALATLAQEPGLSIEQLRVPLGRTQSATVRVVDQLVAEGYAERRAGRDHRAVAVFLTGKGTEAAARVLSSRQEARRRPEHAPAGGTQSPHHRPGEGARRDHHGQGPRRPHLPAV